jgi:hypothetical protein
VQNGAEVTYLQVVQENVKAKPHEVCLNYASREILSDEWQQSPDEHGERSTRVTPTFQATTTRENFEQNRGYRFHSEISYPRNTHLSKVFRDQTKVR